MYSELWVTQAGTRRSQDMSVFVRNYSPLSRNPTPSGSTIKENVLADDMVKSRNFWLASGTA